MSVWNNLFGTKTNADLEKELILQGYTFSHSWEGSTERLLVSIEQELFYFLPLNTIVKFSDIINIELFVDKEEIIKKNGIGRAVVGGMLFGGAGAIIGATTGNSEIKEKINAISINFHTKDINNPIHRFFISTFGKLEGQALYEAQSIYDTLNAIIHQYNENSAPLLSPNKDLPTKNQKYCTNCGAKRPNEGKFCGNCGTPFKL